MNMFYKGNRNLKHIAHSDDINFEEQVKQLLFGRKIVKAEAQYGQTAILTLDNGVQLVTFGNEGCGGCGNGWYFLEALNTCDNAITKVECVVDTDEYGDDAYHIFVYAEDQKINSLQYNGGDNGYYGTGYDLYVVVNKEATE